MLPYTPFTSTDLTSVTGVTETLQGVSDLSSFVGQAQSISGKQVIFFIVGILLLVASLTLIISMLLESAVPPEAIASIAKAAL